MTIYPADMSRKVNQLSEDGTEIYQLISKVESTQLAHSVRLGRIEDQLGDLDVRLDGIGDRLGGLQSSADGLTEQVSVVVAAVTSNND